MGKKVSFFFELGIADGAEVVRFDKTVLAVEFFFEVNERVVAQQMDVSYFFLKKEEKFSKKKN